MKAIKLQIKKRITKHQEHGYSYECDVLINGHKLGHGVTDIKLDMRAGNKPKLLIECIPDEIDLDMPIEDVVIRPVDSKKKYRR